MQCVSSRSEPSTPCSLTMWLMPSRACSAAIFLVLLLAAVAPVRAADGPGASIFVVTHHWHTGIAVSIADVPAGRWPAASVFAGAELVEVGWGDRDFWMAPQETIGLAVKAALAPEASVPRGGGVDGPGERALAPRDRGGVARSRAGPP